jgi:hypothetical protein
VAPDDVPLLTRALAQAEGGELIDCADQLTILVRAMVPATARFSGSRIFIPEQSDRRFLPILMHFPRALVLRTKLGFQRP